MISGNTINASPKAYGDLQNTIVSENRSSQMTCTEVLMPLKTGFQKCVQAVNWMIENRGGLAKITGLILLPAQFISHDHLTSNQIINARLNHGIFNGYIEKIKIPVGQTTIEGIICYPSNWKKEDNSRCILYHNPNGAAVSEFFDYDELSWTPGQLFKFLKCPIILYDYRGVGLNQYVTTNSLLTFHATYESVVVDGQATLDYALNHFQNVEVVGSSLGGGVATASLDRHLTRSPLNANRIIRLINHDSFTTTPRVIFPSVPRIADALGSAIGGKLNAMKPMKNLIDRGVNVTVLYHTNDPIIPFNARMGDYLKSLPKKSNVTVFASSQHGHANLCPNMVEFLFKG